MDSQSFLAQLVSRLAELVPLASPPETSAPGGLLVSLSGGPDSVALLLAARHWAETDGGLVEAAHLNHLMRGDAADQDEAFCHDLCQRLDIHLFRRRLDPRPVARQRGMGLEEAGRHLRHQLLHDLLRERPALGCAATGHHLDDQAETVVMRLFRGTGLDGLRGLAPVAGRIIHPLLSVTRQDIIDFLEAVGQPYRLDATNETGDATRTRVRRELLPLVRDIFGAGSDKLPARLARLVETDLVYLEETAAITLTRLLDELRDTVDGTSGAAPGAVPGDLPVLQLPVDSLLALQPALSRRVLRRYLGGSGGLTRDLELKHVEALLHWLPVSQSGASLDLPHGWRAVREFDRLRFLPPAGLESTLSRTGTYRILVQSEANREVTTPPGSGSDTATTADQAGLNRRQDQYIWRLQCPADNIQGKLRVRPWRPGDRIELLGLGGHKKVSDLLRERRIAVSERPDVQVLEDDLGILWVVGLARAERTRLLPITGHALTITIVVADTEPDRDHSRPGG
ncbi:MAG: tRNA lysidine(34) synthetase TilS [bacterium]